MMRIIARRMNIGEVRFGIKTVLGGTEDTGRSSAALSITDDLLHRSEPPGSAEPDIPWVSLA
jgi:hypothetical protein